MSREASRAQRAPASEPRPRARTSIGQHWLADRDVMQRIVDCAQLGPGDRVLEIGAGPANLTKRLLATGAHVTAVEVDRRFAASLEQLAQLPDHGPRLAVVWGDALALDWEPLWAEAPPERRVLVGNIPYQITSPLLAKMAEARRRFDRAVLMVQREVADRLVAAPGSRASGALTVKMALDFEVRLLFPVSRRAFRPRPAVDSAVIALRPHAAPPVRDEAERALVRRVVEAAFGSRRQQVVNSLARHWRPRIGKPAWVQLLREAGLEPTDRAETIPVAGHVALARTLAAHEKTLAASD